MMFYISSYSLLKAGMEEKKNRVFNKITQFVNKFNGIVNY